MDQQDFMRKFDTSSPGLDSVPITPNDSADILGGPIRQLEILAAGDVCFVGTDGVTDTWPCVERDSIPIRITLVKATGTTVPLGKLKGIR